MADAFQDGKPTLSQTFAQMVDAIEQSLGFLKDCFQYTFSTWADNDAASLDTLTADTIAEKTDDTGVTIDGCLVKDGVAYGAAVAAGTFAVPDSTGNKSVTGVGFAPQTVMFLVAIDASTSVASMGIGWMTASAQAAVSTFANESGPQAASDHSSSQCILITNASADDTVAAQYVSLDADGFTVNFTARAAGYDVYWIALG